MKFKPKEVLVNLPVVLTFASEDEVVGMAAAFNTFVHGKVKMKYEVLGALGGQTIGLFYIQRNNESQELRDEFMRLIEAEEAGTLSSLDSKEEAECDHNWVMDGHNAGDPICSKCYSR
jgi:hypothetical protein